MMRDVNHNTDVRSIVSVPYIVMELPMNLIMKRVGANITLPIMVTLWGMVCACQGT